MFLKLKENIELRCPICSWKRIITDPLEAMSITETSYKLAKEKKEILCPKCGHPIIAQPCILYPGGWEVLKKLIIEEKAFDLKVFIIFGIAGFLTGLNLLLKKKE